jgi:hypothetical protein
MHDLTPFERRLSERLAAELASAVRPFDPQAVAAAAIGRRRMKYSRRSMLLLVAAAAVLVALIGGAILVSSGAFDQHPLKPKLPPLPWPLAGVIEHAGRLNPPGGHSAVTLADGRLLVVPSVDDKGNAAAQIWDPRTGGSTATQPMAHGRRPWSMVRLSDGRVLLTGGECCLAPGEGPTAEIFDPATGAFTLLASRPSTIESSGVLLRDGRVLLSGGYTTLEPDLNGNLEVSYQAEIFDPATSTFRPTPPMHRRRSGHTMQLLSDGRVLLLGGSVSSSRAPEQGQPSVEVFDPTTGQFEEPRGQIVVNEVFDRWAVLGDERVVVLRQPAWGQYPGRSLPMTVHEYDPAKGIEKVGPTIPDSAPFYDIQALVRLSDTRVLVYALDKASALPTGDGDLVEKSWIGILDIESGEFFQIAVLNAARGTVVPMASGSVLILGGHEETLCTDGSNTYSCASESSAVDVVR